MNELVPANVFSGLTTSVGSDDAYAKYAQKKGFLPPIYFSAKGKSSSDGKKYIAPGHYFLKDGEDLRDLGDSIDVLILARGRKAMDYSNRDAMIICHDPTTPEYKRVEADSNEKDLKCMEGPRFLLWERSTGEFYEMFCASAGTKSASVMMGGFLPSADQGIAPATLGSKFRKTAYGTQHDPTVDECSTPFSKLPSEEAMIEQIKAFISAKDSDGKSVPEAKAPSRDR
jgi:hypothetical protein